eukprot:6193544-Pleurochrysis_carterae.AAC.3
MSGGHAQSAIRACRQSTSALGPCIIACLTSSYTPKKVAPPGTAPMAVGITPLKRWPKPPERAKPSGA